MRTVLLQPGWVSRRSGGSRWNAEVAARGACELAFDRVAGQADLVLLDSLYLGTRDVPDTGGRRGWVLHALPEGAVLERLAGAELVVLPGEHLLPQLRGLPVVVCPAGVDAELASLPLPPSGPPVILSAGAISRVKQQDLLARALGELLDLPWHWHVMGEVVDAEVRAAIQLPAERVTFSSGSPAQVNQALARASLCAQASQSENAPLWAREALAAGRPVVSTRVGDLAGILEGRGVLVGDPAELAGALRQVLARLPELLARPRPALPTWDDCAAALARALTRVAPR